MREGVSFLRVNKRRADGRWTRKEILNTRLKRPGRPPYGETLLILINVVRRGLKREESMEFKLFKSHIHSSTKLKKYDLVKAQYKVVLF